MKRQTGLLFIAAMLFSGLIYANGAGHHAHMHRNVAEAEQTAFGIAGNPKNVARTIEVSMSDAMRFSPASLKIEQGETIKFVVKNDGKLLHELVLGRMEDLEKHAELMRKFDGMEHDEPYMVHVRPRASDELIWHFNRPGEFHFGCLIPGHFEAGMIGKIVVSER